MDNAELVNKLGKTITAKTAAEKTLKSELDVIAKAGK